MGQTLGIRAGRFLDLVGGPKVRRRATGSNECPGYCLHRDELRPCPAECECAYVREAIYLRADWPKNPRAEGSHPRVDGSKPHAAWQR
jgi:hypothetical protein